MKKLLFLLVLATASPLFAQNFGLTVTPAEQICYAGDKVEYEIKISTISSFSATVYLSAKSLPSTSLSSTISNPPYDPIKCSIIPQAADTGTHIIEFIGKNTKDNVKIQCKLTVLPLGYWKHVSMPSGGRISNLTLNAEGQCTGARQSTEGKFDLSEYVKDTWQTRRLTLPNNTWLHSSKYAFDKNGHLWITESAKRLTKYDGTFFYSTDLDVSFPEKAHVDYHLKKNKDGDLFYLLSDEHKVHIVMYSNDTWKFLRKDIQSIDGGEQLCVGNDNTLWIATSNSLTKIYGDNYEKTENISVDGVQNIKVIACYESKLFCITLTGFYAYENGVWTNIKLPFVQDYINSVKMAVGNNGEVYITVDKNGLFIYNTDGSWKHFSYENSPIGNKYITELIVDKHDNVWMLSTDYRDFGFVVYNPTGIRTFLITTSVNDNDDNVTGFINNSLDIKQTQNALHITLPEEREQVVDVYDMQGNKVIQYNLSGINEKECELNISSLMNGIYIVRVGQRSAKFLINK